MIIFGNNGNSDHYVKTLIFAERSVGLEPCIPVMLSFLVSTMFISRCTIIIMIKSIIIYITSNILSFSAPKRYGVNCAGWSTIRNRFTNVIIVNQWSGVDNQKCNHQSLDMQLLMFPIYKNKNTPVNKNSEQFVFSIILLIWWISEIIRQEHRLMLTIMILSWLFMKPVCKDCRGTRSFGR